MSQIKKLTKEILSDLYLNQKLSFNKIAEKFKIGKTTVACRMKKYNIKARDKKKALLMAVKKPLPDEEKIRHFYIAKDLSILATAKIMGISERLTRRALRKYKIPRRKGKKGIHTKHVFIPKTMNEDLAFIIGAYFGDGSIPINSGRFTFGVKDREFALNVKHKLDNVFDVNSKLKKYGLWICYLDSVKVTNFLIKKTENKTKVPNEIINGNDNIKSSFLQAFFDSEATVGKYQLALNQKDINILRQIRVLCISMGIKPSEVKLYKFNRGKYKGNIYSRMHITHKNNLNKFKNLIGFSIDRKQIKLEGIHA